MARLAVWFAIILLTLYLVFFGGGWQGIYTTELRSTSVVLAGLALGAWALVAWRRPEWRPRSVMLPAIAACLASLAISTVFSRHPRLSVEYLGYAIVLAALYLLLVRILAQPWFRARVAALATALAVVIGVLFLVLVVGHWIAWWGLVGRLTVPPLRPNFEGLVYGNPSAVMTMSVLLSASAVASIGFASPGRVVVGGAIVVLSGLVTLISGSRAGWLGVAAAIVLTAVVWLASTERRVQAAAIAARLRATRSGMIGAGLAAAAAIGGLAVLAPAILRRVFEGGEDLRAAYSAISIQLFRESPVVGVGPGMWVVSRTTYTRPPETDYYIPHGHSIWLQTPAELGVVGIAAGLLLLAALAWLVRDGLRDPDRVRRTWAWAALFALLYFGAHQFFDLYANMAGVLFAAAIPVAWLDATATRMPRPMRRSVPTALSNRGAMALAITSAVISVTGLWLTELPAAKHAQAVAFANAGDWVAAGRVAQEVLALDPAWPPYQMTAALADLRVGNAARAAQELGAVVAVDDLPEAWLALARAEVDLGRMDRARSAIERALRLGYQRPAISMAAGDLALPIDRDIAIEAFANAVSRIPSLASDPYWGSKDPALLTDVVDLALSRARDDIPWELALMSGDPNLARTFAATLPSISGGLAMDVISAWEGDAAARTRINERCAADPLSLGPLGWCARLAGRADERGEQERYLSWAEAIIGGASASGVELRVATHDLVGRSDEGAVALFWGYYTYRRPTPWDMIAGGLVHLTFE